MPGILSGAIAGAAGGVSEVARISIKEKQEARLAAAKIKAEKVKAKTKAEKEKKPPKTIKVKRFDPDLDEYVEVTLQYDEKTDTWDEPVGGKTIAKYSRTINEMRASGVPDEDIAAKFKRDTGQEMPFGVVKRTPVQKVTLKRKAPPAAAAAPTPTESVIAPVKEPKKFTGRQRRASKRRTEPLFPTGAAEGRKLGRKGYR